MNIPQNPFGPPPPPPAAPPPNPFAPTVAAAAPPQAAHDALPAFAPNPAFAPTANVAATTMAAPIASPAATVPAPVPTPASHSGPVFAPPLQANPLPTPDFGPKPTGPQPPAFPGQPTMAEWQDRTVTEARQRAGLPPIVPQPGMATRVPEPNVLQFPGGQVLEGDTIVPTKELVREYIELRDNVSEINDKVKDTIEPLKLRMGEIEREMLGRLDHDEVQSMKTPAGTVFKKTTTRYNVADGEVLMEWIVANSRFDLLARSLKPDAIKEYADENGTLPPGVDTFSQVVAQFRK